MIPATQPDVAIIGAGPYGLSIAAHLRSQGVDFRIFGTPMQTWRSHMPKGMFLKSEGWASNLFDPTGGYSLQHYCADEGIAYGESHVPVSLKTFTQYGLSFQRRFVPAVEDVLVTALDGRSSLFELQLASGETLKARRVVIATGAAHAGFVPSELAELPAELLSHSGCHHDLSGFKGRHVTVIGGGQSALETAALLHEAGAEALLVARRSSLVWNEWHASGRRSLYERLRRPMSELGSGLGLWLYANAPMWFRLLPRAVRIAHVKKALGPAGAWWLKDRVVGRLPMLLGYSLQGAAPDRHGALVQLHAADGARRQIATDHVIAATGYQFTLRSLPFLSERLLGQLCSVQQTPVLSANFESSVAGLYFTGLASANQFGPVMRFLHGAGYSARRVSRHIAAGGRRRHWPLLAGSCRASKCQDDRRAEQGRSGQRGRTMESGAARA
jgi:thioredoxin reductase